MGTIEPEDGNPIRICLTVEGSGYSTVNRHRSQRTVDDRGRPTPIRSLAVSADDVADAYAYSTRIRAGRSSG